MYVARGNHASTIWIDMLEYLYHEGIDRESHAVTKDGHSTTTTKEVIHATFQLDNPRNRIVFHRPINPAFAIAEVIWILNGFDSYDFLRFWNPRMKIWSDDRQRFHGAYGRRLGFNSDFKHHSHIHKTGGYDQFNVAYERLKEDPNSRQVVLQIWDKSEDLAYQNGSFDIPCNITSCLLVRDQELHWLQTMRSNDIIWGTPYNFIQWTTLQEVMATLLGYEVGTFTLTVNSLHYYDRHKQDVSSILSDRHQYDANYEYLNDVPYELPENESCLYFDETNFKTIMSGLAIYCLGLAQSNSIQHIDSILQNAFDKFVQDSDDDVWNWILILAAEACRRKGFTDRAIELTASASSFWNQSYVLWYESQQ